MKKMDKAAVLVFGPLLHNLWIFFFFYSFIKMTKAKMLSYISDLLMYIFYSSFDYLLYIFSAPLESADCWQKKLADTHGSKIIFVE